MQSKENKTVLMVLFLVLCTFNIHAAWLNNVQIDLTQPDGTVLEAYATGDEFHNWAHDANNFTIIQDPITGYWCWGREVDGDVVSTGYPIHRYTPQSLGLTPGQNISEERYSELREPWDLEFNARSSRAPSLGIVQSLTVFIRFADQGEFEQSFDHWDERLNSPEEGANSMMRYFFDASYEQLIVESPIFPLSDGNLIFSYQCTHPRAYYMPHSASNPIGYTGGSNGAERRRREQGLLRDAIAYIHHQIPAYLDLDSDGDGRVDNVNFIIRGRPGAWATLLWPHKWTLTQFDVRIHGLRVWEYNFNIETETNVGVLVHEFAHTMGIPDFYRYNTNIQPNTPVGIWSIMAADRNPPQSMSAHIKAKYTQWTQPIPMLTQSGTVTLLPITLSQYEHAFRINSPFSTSEYFVVEYRSRNTGMLIDSNIPGSGLVVWRVNSSLNGNAQGHTDGDELYVFRPGGTLQNNGTINQAFLSAQSGRTELHEHTNPRLFLSNGASAGITILNISEADDTISFFVDLDGPDLSAVDESFENGFNNFDWILNPNAPWVITDETWAHGQHSAASPLIAVGESSRLEIPLVVYNGYIQFHFRTATQSGNELVFLLNGRLIRSWSGNNQWTHFAFPISAGTHTFTWEFRKTNADPGGTDRVWIDQIAFPEITGHILFPARNVSLTNEYRNITLSWDAPVTSNMQTPPRPTLRGYYIIQNSLRLNETPVTERQFTINNSPGGNLSFWVIAAYDAGESGASNASNLSLPFAIPTNLRASMVNNRVFLEWDFPYESPSVLGFRVFRDGVNVTPVLVPPSPKSFHDVNLTVAGVYMYQVRTVYESPNGTSALSEPLDVHFVDSDDEIMPVYVTHLGVNYPNPFNPETSINFALSNDGNVEINIYNVRGQKVRTLLNTEMSRGTHSVVWNGNDDNGNQVGSGIYFYRMKADEYTSIRKMMLLK
jgi:M6 family metalloprotease-like protein